MATIAEVEKLAAEGRFWAPNLSNELHLSGASILIGGPRGQELAEHSHDFIQISAGFRSTGEDGASARTQKAPDYFSKPGFARAIPIGLPHRGGWSNGTEVVVVHVRESLIESVADELRVSARPNLQFDKISTDLFVLELLKAAGREMRATGVFNRAYFESLVVVLVGHLIRTYGRYRSVLLPAGCHLNPRQMQLVDEFINTHLAIVEPPSDTGRDLARSCASGKRTVSTGLNESSLFRRTLNGDDRARSQRERLELLLQNFP
jgi:hypothetical protein